MMIHILLNIKEKESAIFFIKPVGLVARTEETKLAKFQPTL